MALQLAAVAVVATGLLPLDAAADVTRRMAPILLFLVAITVLAELAEVAKVFDVAALHSSRLARGRTGRAVPAGGAAGDGDHRAARPGHDRGAAHAGRAVAVGCSWTCRRCRSRC